MESDSGARLVVKFAAGDAGFVVPEIARLTTRTRLSNHKNKAHPKSLSIKCEDTDGVLLPADRLL